MTEKLKELYINLQKPPSYSAKLKHFLPDNKRKAVDAFLQSFELHSKNKRITKKRFPRRQVKARFPFDVFMADLFMYPQYKYFNGRFVYILLLIDCFTKMVYVCPMKKKNKEETARAFETIFNKFDRYPIFLVTDNGKEFFNSDVRDVMISHGINHYSTPTRTSWHASMAERAIRTIKSRIARYMQAKKTKKWIDVIDQIVDNYNHTPHSSHKLKPVNVNESNRVRVYKTMFPNIKITRDCRLKKGDKIRILRDKKQFEKGYTQNWSNEIYVIKSVRHKDNVCWYKLEDIEGDTVPGIWYYNQLNLVQNDSTSSTEKRQ